MTTLIVGIAAASVLLTLGLAAAALRSEHLIVLQLGRQGTMLLERRPHGRYEPLAAWEVPGALGRYLGGVLSGLPHPARVVEERTVHARGVQVIPGA